MLTQDEMRAYKQRWQLVTEVEAEEKKHLSINQRWHQLNTLFQLASALDLHPSSEDKQEEVIRERWQKISMHYLSIEDVMEFANRSRVVLLRHEKSGINVDISLGLLPFEIETVERSQEHQAGALFIRLPTPEDLIILKAVAHRPKDMLDIASVIAASSELDVERIAFWVQQFSDLLEMPVMWSDLKKLLPQ